VVKEEQEEEKAKNPEKQTKNLEKQEKDKYNIYFFIDIYYV